MILDPLLKSPVPRERKTWSRMASFEIPLLDRRGQGWLIITSILSTSNKNPCSKKCTGDLIT